MLELIWQSQPLPERLIKYYGMVEYYVNNLPQKALKLELGHTTLKCFWKDLMTNSNEYNETLFLEIMKQILEGFVEFHNTGYILIDFNASNILIMEESSSNTTLNLKLIDFAESVKENNEINPQPIEIPTVSLHIGPEIYDSRTYDFNVSKQTDIWSFAMVCLDLLTSAPFFEDFYENNKIEINRVVYGDNDINEERNEGETRIRFLRRMVEISYQKNSRPKEKNFTESIVNNLNDILSKNYPKVMSILKECFYKNQKWRPDSKYLLDLTKAKLYNYEPFWVNAHKKERKKYLLEKGESSSTTMINFGKE
ncbi:unnamed protein product [Meloidogyne enterolobii]|uniref:Uncharacterized protein n=1 Tax=Meloidogyne enterolobii TaxID=390850 RepID=A0ACB1ACP7_MELEN